MMFRSVVTSVVALSSGIAGIAGISGVGRTAAAGQQGGAQAQNQDQGKKLFHNLLISHFVHAIQGWFDQVRMYFCGELGDQRIDQAAGVKPAAAHRSSA